MTADWIDRMRGASVAGVAAALGYATRPAGSSVTVSPCPACKAERRHASRRDKRGAVGVGQRTPAGWRCHACGVTGDALHFVALHFAGRKLGELDAGERARVREWCVGYAGGDRPDAPRPAAQPAAPLPPRYAPADELRAVWAAAVPVASSPAVAHWLREDRAIDPLAVDARLARAIDPVDVDFPLWASFEDGRTYAGRGFRLLVPMFDHEGRVRSLIFRRCYSARGPKSVPPRGFDRVGLVMANAAAHAMLRGGTLDELLVIAEGEMDFLAWSTTTSAAVLGIVSGSWTLELAARIPNGARVLIATDHDAAGAQYAAKIITSLADRARAGRVRLERWKGAAA